MHVPYTRTRSLLASCFIAILIGSTAALAQRAGFVAPPRTIADIAAILDQEKPNPVKRAKADADADAEPPAHADRAKLRDFYFNRAHARFSIGRLAAAIGNCKKAIEYSSEDVNDRSSIEGFEEYLLRLDRVKSTMTRFADNYSRLALN